MILFACQIAEAKARRDALAIELQTEEDKAQAQKDAFSKQVAEEEQQVQAKRDALAKQLADEEQQVQAKRDALAKQLADEEQQVQAKRDALAKQVAEEEQQAQAKRDALSQELTVVAAATSEHHTAEVAAVACAKNELHRLEGQLKALEYQKQEVERLVQEAQDQQKAAVDSSAQQQNIASEEIKKLEAQVSSLQGGMSTAEEVSGAAGDLFNEITKLANNFNGLKQCIDASASDSILQELSEAVHYSQHVPDVTLALDKANLEAANVEARVVEARENEKQRWEEVLTATRAQKATLDNACALKQQEMAKLGQQLNDIQTEILSQTQAVHSKQLERENIEEEMTMLTIRSANLKSAKLNQLTAPQNEPSDTEIAATQSECNVVQQLLEDKSSQLSVIEEKVKQALDETSALESRREEVQQVCAELEKTHSAKQTAIELLQANSNKIADERNRLADEPQCFDTSLSLEIDMDSLVSSDMATREQFEQDFKRDITTSLGLPDG